LSASPTLRSPARRLLADALLVARGTVFGQAPFVLVMPLITRLYASTELGIYGLALAFVSMTAPIVGLRFELAAISARASPDSRALLVLSALAIVPTTGVCTAVLYLLTRLGVGSYDALSDGMVLATGALVAASGSYATLRCWLARRYRFRLLASSLIVQGWVRASLLVVVAPLGAGASLLLGAELVSRLCAVALMVRGGALVAALRAVHVPLASLRESALKYWKYPVLLAPSALIDAAAAALPVPILASCYGLAAAGKFALVQRLVLLPVALIAGSVGDVFHAHAADMAGRKPAATQAFLATTALRLLLFAVALYLPVGLVAPFTAGWIFGAQWSDAGPMIAALAPMCVAQTVVNPISRGLLLGGREERKLLADLACLVLPITALYLARREPMIVAIECFSAASVLAFIIYYVVIVGSLRAGLAPRPPDATNGMV